MSQRSPRALLRADLEMGTHLPALIQAGVTASDCGMLPVLAFSLPFLTTPTPFSPNSTYLTSITLATAAKRIIRVVALTAEVSLTLLTREPPLPSASAMMGFTKPSPIKCSHSCGQCGRDSNHSPQQAFRTNRRKGFSLTFRYPSDHLSEHPRSALLIF
ncbi:uncharacterized protein BcabD6B2_58570 [Babesia caballi]|uniref:Uncharacterized protein n=1 Tax=Babesia caballi TaxID=5871 RepID=A0AAV4M1S9_BABCB|nr:hypothetical protein BcabD6B2_58570 [Babesia caballi]